MKENKNFPNLLRADMQALSNRLPLVESLGNHRVIIENHAGIREYDPLCICVCTCGGHITVKGSCLKIAVMTKFRLAITGHIDSIHYMLEGADK